VPVLARPAAAQTVTGFAELKGSGYSDRTNGTDPWVSGWATALAKVEGKLGPARYAVSARAELVTSAERGPLVLDPADRELRRSPLSMREAWLRAPVAPSVDVTLGRFQLGWGKTDGYSPADAFLPRDLSDPYGDEKLPLWGARLQGQRGPVRLDALWAVTTTPWRLPVLSGRHAPLPVAGVSLVDGAADVPRTGFGAVRLLASWGDWDVGIHARTGVRPAPLLVVRLDGIVLGPGGLEVPIDRRFAREDAVGVEVSRVTGPFVLRAEGAALLSSDPGLGDALVWTLGLERAFGDGTLLVTLAANARGTPVDPLLLLDRAILPAAIAAWSRTERWGSWRLVLTCGLRHGDGLAKADVAYDLTDVWKASLGVDVPYGSSAGPFGSRPESRRAWLAARRSW